MTYEPKLVNFPQALTYGKKTLTQKIHLYITYIQQGK